MPAGDAHEARHVLVLDKLRGKMTNLQAKLLAFSLLMSSSIICIGIGFAMRRDDAVAFGFFSLITSGIFFIRLIRAMRDM